MTRGSETVEQTWTRDRKDADSERPPVPGIVLVFSGGEPRLSAFPLDHGAIEIGRDGALGVTLEDACMSRRHARVARDGKLWTVRDLGSRNGTAVDGEATKGELRSETARVLRTGDSLFFLCPDIGPYQGATIERHESTLMGPVLRETWQAIARVARLSDTLHVTGESGAGKELAARAFHSFGPQQSGPFIAVNCAAIPEGMAERLLFGTRRGAYSGAAADADGYVQAANRGTLFLDEVAELDLGVQAKLLRVLENREVIALGAARPQGVSLQICSATHKDLRAEVADKRLREDLYFRIGRPEVRLPPLRDRLEEMPWIIDREVKQAGASLVVHASLVEACMLRYWPGNVRELITEIRAAAHAAIAAGSARVEDKHLHASAGQRLTSTPTVVQPDGAESTLEPSAAAPGARPSKRTAHTPKRDRIEQVLRQENGNVTRAARVLGMHRTQLRRWLAQNGIDWRTFCSDSGA